MLIQIHIRDLATIEELQISLENGCTMITGETGAGKSVFIEAIELALGARASQNLVRQGKEKADISLSFDVTNFPKVNARLRELDLQQDAECIIRRVISNDGRSRSYINGSPQPLQLVKEFGELLFHLHGQHQQQVLLSSETQREMLDRYANHLSLANQVKAHAEHWRTLDAQIKLLRSKTEERSTRSDYLKFQLDELHQLKLREGEWKELEAEHHRLTHSEELMRNLQHVLQLLSQDESQNVLAALNETRKILEAIASVEPKSKDWVNTLNSALIQVSDLESELSNYLENTELDPEKLQQVEERVSQIFNLSRKHKIAPQELCVFQQKLETEFNTLNSSDEDIQHLEAQQKLIEKQYCDAAVKLSEGRQNAAVKLEKEITATIRSLSLPHGQFKIALEIENSPLNIHGNERINFLIKTNPDQNLQSLAKVISGGELSRLSLAAHLALANRTNIPTLIFDEVDTGLSGATAEKIGKLLRKLGDTYQVFCISHQPQVAANGHHQMLVEKIFVGKSTHTRLRILDKEERTKEIARMLGGEKITEKTLEHAREVLGN